MLFPPSPISMRRRDGFFFRISSKISEMKPLLLLFCLLLGMVPEIVLGEQIKWRELALGLEVATLGGDGLLPYESVFVRASANSFQPRIVRAAEFGKKRWDARSACLAARSAVCINSNFFDENGDPLGVVISQGTLFQKLHKGGNTLSGILSITKRGASIVHRNDFYAESVLEATQAGPRIISMGKSITGIKDDSSSRRSGVCIDDENRLIFYLASRRLMGVRIEELQSLLRQDGISCREALNLDGGGSSQLFINPRFIPEGMSDPSIQGKDPVPVFLALFQR